MTRARSPPAARGDARTRQEGVRVVRGRGPTAPDTTHTALRCASSASTCRLDRRGPRSRCLLDPHRYPQRRSRAAPGTPEWRQLALEMDVVVNSAGFGA